MSWRLTVQHTTTVSYSGAARASYNEARMTPLTLPGQTVLGSSMSVGTPAPVWTYLDYWGTIVSSFDVQAPHEALTVRAQATVETSPPPGLARPLPWARLREQAGGDRLQEYLAATPRTTVDGELAAEAAQRAVGGDPVTAAGQIAEWVHDRVRYVTGSTGVQTSAQEAWDQSQGVCQDIAHLTIALLRAAGLPARYVSGYLHFDPAAERGKAVAGQSHAWVEYWTGQWVGCDPTNLAPVGERYVTVARGRDYADVAPLKGIYHGAPSLAPDVTVEITRL
jgi:transglutaminase-like putative cysteine protease